jgi:hypothetical protein
MGVKRTWPVEMIVRPIQEFAHRGGLADLEEQMDA